MTVTRIRMIDQGVYEGLINCEHYVYFEVPDGLDPWKVAVLEYKRELEES